MRLSKKVRKTVCVACTVAVLMHGNGMDIVRAVGSRESGTGTAADFDFGTLVTARSAKWSSTAEYCRSAAEDVTQQFLTKSANKAKQESINISSEKFSATAVRLNTEIYDETVSVVNVEHIKRDYGEGGTALYESYLDNIDAIMPLALTTCETMGWADSRYTWCSAVYSRLLDEKGTNMRKCKVEQVNTDTYVVAGLCTYMGCGKNCTAGTADHHHTIGNNDNDSLGPLQILRRYVETNGYIQYPCGETTVDLMCWRDNAEYFLHRQSETFASKTFWNRGHVIQSKNELMALVAVAHNTGSAYLSSQDAGSLWHDSESVFKFCEVLGSEETYKVLSGYVDEWYCDLENTDIEQFMLAGSYYRNNYDSILREIGVDKRKYASSFGHKQYYPLKAVLNYMSLDRLYHSGCRDGEEVCY